MPQNVEQVLADSKKILDKASTFPKMPQAEKPAPEKHEFSGASYALAKPKSGPKYGLKQEAESAAEGLKAKGEMIQKAQKALE